MIKFQASMIVPKHKKEIQKNCVYSGKSTLVIYMCCLVINRNGGFYRG